jgi:hypothetical protein
MSTDIPADSYEQAMAADHACHINFCRREDCSGFLCRNALDAAILAERLSATERAAKIAEEWIGTDHDGCADIIAAAIRSQP